MTTTASKARRSMSRGGSNKGKVQAIKILNNRQLHFLFVCLVGLCVISFLFLACSVPSHRPLLASEPSFRFRGSRGNFLEPIDRMRYKRNRGKTSKMSIQDIMRDNSLDSQISNALNKANVHPDVKVPRNPGAALHVPNRGNSAEIGRAWGNGVDEARVLGDSRENFNSCDRLFGPHGMVEDSSSGCVEHELLKWVVCPLPPLRLHMDKIHVSYGNSIVEDVLGRKEKDERILWTEGSVDISEKVPKMQLQTQLLGGTLRFLTDGMQTSSVPIKRADAVLNVLVFREAYANTEWGLKTLFQAYTALRHMQVTDNFRVIFMDGHARTATDDAWQRLFGADRVFHLRNFYNMTGISTLGRSILVQSAPSSLGEEAVAFYGFEDKCRGPSYLRDFRDQLLRKYGFRHPSKTDPISTSSRNVTLLYARPSLAHPRSNIPENWTRPDINRTREALQQAYKVSLDRVRVVTLDGLSFHEQLELLFDTDLLISPNHTTSTIMSIFLPPHGEYFQFRGRTSRRLGYILNTLDVVYDKPRMPVALRYSGLFDIDGRDVGPNDNDASDPEDNPAFRRTCDSLLGWDSIVTNGTCRSHRTITWTLCAMPPVRFRAEKIYGSQGNESVDAVSGRKEAEERLFFSERSVESLGSLDPTMVSSCPTLESIQSFWKAFYPLKSDATTFRGSLTVDETPTMLVFRETYANPCWSILMAYQTWLIKKLFNAGVDFRILWMDGHAYTGMDEFWRDIFGPRVYHFKRFVDLTGITAFNQSFVVHGDRMPLGNEAVQVYKFGSVCSSNSTLHDFRRFVLNKYGYTDENDPTGSMDQISNRSKKLTLLIRKPYEAHPRADGVMDRMVHDVNETVDALRLKYPNHEVRSVSFEGIPFREQLKVIRETDVLVAVHGAGNIHVLFLPFEAKFIELYPKGFSNRLRFQYIANALGIYRRSIRAGVYRKVNSIIEMTLAKDIPRLPDF